ncbi:MAG: hypothetical protein JSV97_08495 [candidate division WOR-3 bacterium]|nr:MAG: hypothetical protein JSV97_08495 [candidate division WOR-3 bacterium]
MDQGSTILVVGVFGERVAVDMATVNENELSILGTARYVIEDFERAIELLSARKVSLEPLITHHVNFTDYTEAYRVIEERSETVMKVMVCVNEE